ncbi:HAD family phosphatase [Lutimonas vermicola]|uniref:HAD family phosphatase n=1 Tax=Lutimonas vermicola TaxID=414288 RepID=A0ABU9L2Y3_9FLAO
MKMPKIEAVIFDLGGVLVDWNPEYLYAKIFKNDAKKMTWFLNTVCTPAWNMEQDAGRTFEEGIEILTTAYPEYEPEIRSFFERWEEMIKSENQDTVVILKSLSELNKVKLYALTNWSSETFPIAQRRFDFLKRFEGIVVSGEEKTRKPFSKIYEITLDRYGLKAENCLFIDDSFENIEAAKLLGFNTVHFTNALQLNMDLKEFGLI